MRLRQEAAVDDEEFAGHVARRARREEQRGARQVLRLADAAQRIGADVMLELLLVGEQCAGELGADQAGQDARCSGCRRARTPSRTSSSC